MLHTSLVTTSRITTPTHEIGASYANELADLMELTGGNATILYIKNVGTIMNPQYELIQPHHIKQLATLAAVRILRERDGMKWGMCNTIVTNPTDNEGNTVDMTEAILAQL